MSPRRPDDLFNRPIGDEHDWLDALLARARENASEISDSSIRFVDDMTVRLGQFGVATRVSDRQRKWLDDIERQLDEAGVPRDPDDPGDGVARPVDEVLR